MQLYDQVQAAAAYIQAQVGDFRPDLGFILGTGLSNLAKEIKAIRRIPYAEIPHFPVSTVESHAGELVLGELEGRPVVALAGRFHYYEGYSMAQLTMPVRVLKALGISRLVISSAVGSVNADMEAGDIVLIQDHINLLPDNPLRGRNDLRFGPRFPDMLKAYDQSLNARALSLGQSLGLRIHQGVYVALAGPNLETPAEYRFMNRIGADVVGMSTVPEVLVAKHSELPVFVATVVANRAFPIEDLHEVSVEEVISVVQNAEPKLTQLIKTLLPEL